jgi:hypothetical protein
MQTIGCCWHCRAPLTVADYGRETLCRGCGKPTRACRNCADFAPGRPDDCLQAQADKVLDKQRATACEFFQPAADPPRQQATPADQLRAAAEALFK